MNILIFFLFLFVAVVELMFFGFHPGDDGVRWLALTKLFSGQSDPSQVWFHVAFNPLFSFVGVPLIKLGMAADITYCLVNLSVMLLTALALYSLTAKLTKNLFLSLLTSCLFLVDYQTIRQSFLIYPDILTWLFILLILNFSAKIWLGKLNSLKSAFWWGALLALATLLKQNLLFFFPIYPLTLLACRERKLLVLVTVSVVTLVAIVGAYYGWVWSVFHHLPWDALAEGEKNLGFAPWRQLFEFAPTYLYLWPFIILGLRRIPLTFPLIVWGSYLILTIIPIFLWPYPASRFNFTTFWFFLPLAATGLNYIFRDKKILILLFLIGLFIMNNLRLVMTIRGETHGEFILSLLSQIR
ncbi:MAG: hypothetical protein M1484_01115 [Patescibacteria group bacterium]|nr:hypothetical protein [Patescibacteria group bacterium]